MTSGTIARRRARRDMSGRRRFSRSSQFGGPGASVRSQDMYRAYARLQIKAIREDARIITGLATTPTPDRTGDVVEPTGALFELPLPLLWQHDAKQPIGSVTKA